MNPPPPLAGSILETIGNTPLVELRRLSTRLGLTGRLLAKLEYFSPGASKKDRVALEIVRTAKADGSLAEGQAVVELTSGNTGTGLAIVCRALGHPFVAVMSRGNSVERARMMAALGAEVVLVDQAPGSLPGRVSGEDLARVDEVAGRVVADRGAFRARQFEREGSVLAHERHTGPELWEQSGGDLDAYVDCPGTSGSLTGVARALKARDPAIRVFAVEPGGAAVLAGHPPTDPGHRIQGAGYARSGADLPLFDPGLVDGYLTVGDEEAIGAARMLAEEEGIFAGFSTGAHLAAAIRLLGGEAEGASIAFLACDGGLKYLSTDLYP
ncbi:PLP-dependent cysteine synthase family protein [Tautonia plasticadhaerens]|uniref:Cysteine synthase n=1 Tax=Tautonia plasticadhaerens TaxID=2527974 RepID=A0A518HAD1_9BACT|nr:cysteine synthase family protein [Tautonia plasticadhaerens]QDV37815.1 Cysteine synthase [Tautonia plasticadhaerens]